MSAPTYRVVSSKKLDNGEVLVKVATQDGKYRTRRIKPTEGGGILAYQLEVNQPLNMIIMETSARTPSGVLIGFHFYVTEKTRMCEVVKLLQTLPRIRPHREALHAQPQYLNAAD